MLTRRSAKVTLDYRLTVILNQNCYIVCLNEDEAKRDKAVRKHIEEKMAHWAKCKV
ncbi:hypothetical protein [Desulfosporosinus shakirovi]|uniref:hypothetical protein n=1 Tax=Desulfosporosinus shakirovi TaxID=2885154 RepID=UPI001E4A1064|nr:hypothetical protein [Desulfosporosinus sp. SRJS8]MCB8818327.1 hypothetical protein [Desulfosporosinus sp. SRJS8]